MPIEYGPEAIIFRGGAYDTDKGILFYVDDEPHPRVRLGVEGDVEKGNGAVPPTPLTSGGGVGARKLFLASDKVIPVGTTATVTANEAAYLAWLAPVTEFGSLSLAANTAYSFELTLAYVKGTVTPPEFWIDVPTGTVGKLILETTGFYEPILPAATHGWATGWHSVLNDLASPELSIERWHGVFKTAVTAGNLTLRFGQQDAAPAGANVTLKAGTALILNEA